VVSALIKWFLFELFSVSMHLLPAVLNQLFSHFRPDIKGTTT